MENCVSATHRAVLNARALQANKIGRAGPRLTPRQEQRLAYVRNAVEHSDEKLLGMQKFKSSPPFGTGEPYSLRLANSCMVIGTDVLTHKELVSAMTKCHKTIEVIRGSTDRDTRPSLPQLPAADRPGQPAAHSPGPAADQLPPGAEPADGHPLLIGYAGGIRDGQDRSQHAARFRRYLADLPGEAASPLPSPFAARITAHTRAVPPICTPAGASGCYPCCMQNRHSGVFIGVPGLLGRAQFRCCFWPGKGGAAWVPGPSRL
jgi:hypothetical protein